jgi:CBS domain-containing protein
MQTLVRDILKAKGSEVITCEGRETVLAVAKKMVDHNVGAVVMMDGGAVCGIFSERDFLRKMVQDPHDPSTTLLREIATCNVVCVDPGYTVSEAMAIMTEVHIRHLPVMEHGRLVGLVSIGDLVKQVSRDQETHIRYLTDYVSGKYPG